MKTNKTSDIKLRISPDLKEKFFAACEAMEETPSRVLHSYIKELVKAEERRGNEKWQSNTRQS